MEKFYATLTFHDSLKGFLRCQFLIRNTRKTRTETYTIEGFTYFILIAADLDAVYLPLLSEMVERFSIRKKDFGITDDRIGLRDGTSIVSRTSIAWVNILTSRIARNVIDIVGRNIRSAVCSLIIAHYHVVFARLDSRRHCPQTSRETDICIETRFTIIIGCKCTRFKSIVT